MRERAPEMTPIRKIATAIVRPIQKTSGIGAADYRTTPPTGRSPVQHDFALASRTVFYAMAGVMALAFVVSLATMPSGKVEDVVEEPGVAAGPQSATSSP